MNVGTKTLIIFNLLFFIHINQIISILLLLLDWRKKSLHTEIRSKEGWSCVQLWFFLPVIYAIHPLSIYWDLLRARKWTKGFGAYRDSSDVDHFAWDVSNKKYTGLGTGRLHAGHGSATDPWRPLYLTSKTREELHQ